MTTQIARTNEKQLTGQRVVVRSRRPKLGAENRLEGYEEYDRHGVVCAFLQSQCMDGAFIDVQANVVVQFDDGKFQYVHPSRLVVMSDD